MMTLWRDGPLPAPCKWPSKSQKARGRRGGARGGNRKTFRPDFPGRANAGMDGFTVCSKIRETVLNRTTPVVFVTGHSDFKARTQAALSGGGDLIGKPFLTAEVTVKALTFALRGRLQRRKTSTDAVLQNELRSRESSPNKCLPERPRWPDAVSVPAERAGEATPGRTDFAS